MRLERHVGGLGQARSVNYLEQRGWRQLDGQWLGPQSESEHYRLSRAVHHQLTVDLAQGLASAGWQVVGFSARGYAQLKDPVDQRLCSLPAALRRQARREQRPVREFTYGLFLAALCG